MITRLLSGIATLIDDEGLQPLDLTSQSPQLQEPRTASTVYHTASPGELLSGPTASLQATSSSEADSKRSSADFRVAQSTLGLSRCHLQILSGERPQALHQHYSVCATDFKS